MISLKCFTAGLGLQNAWNHLAPREYIHLGEVECASLLNTHTNEASLIHSTAWRTGQFDIMSTASQTQLSHASGTEEPPSGYTFTDLHKVSHSTGGVLTALMHPEIDSFPEAYAHVIPAMKQKTKGLETPVVSWHSLNGKECPAVWNKKDNHNPKVKRFVLVAGDAQMIPTVKRVSKDIQQIFNVPSDHILDYPEATSTLLEQGMIELGEKIRAAEKAGYKAEVLVSLHAHGTATVNNFSETSKLESNIRKRVNKKFEIQKHQLNLLLDQKHDEHWKNYRNKTLEHALREEIYELLDLECNLNKEGYQLIEKMCSQEKRDELRKAKQREVPEGEATNAYITLGGNNLFKEQFQKMLDTHLPKETRGLVWINSCHSGAWQSLGAGRLPEPGTRFTKLG